MSRTLTANTASCSLGTTRRQLILQYSIVNTHSKRNRVIRRTLCFHEKGQGNKGRPVFATAAVSSLYASIDSIATHVIAKDSLESQRDEFANGAYSHLIEQLLEKYGKEIWGTPLEERGGPDAHLVPANFHKGATDLFWERLEHRHFIALQLEHLAFEKARSFFNNHIRVQQFVARPDHNDTSDEDDDSDQDDDTDDEHPMKTLMVILHVDPLKLATIVKKRRRDGSGRFLPSCFDKSDGDDSEYRPAKCRASARLRADQRDEDVNEQDSHPAVDNASVRHSTTPHDDGTVVVSNGDRALNENPSLDDDNDHRAGDRALSENTGPDDDNDHRAREGSDAQPNGEVSPAMPTPTNNFQFPLNLPLHLSGGEVQPQLVLGETHVANVVETLASSRSKTHSEIGAESMPNGFTVSYPHGLYESDDDAKPVIDLTDDNDVYIPRGTGRDEQPSQHNNLQTLPESEVPKLRKALERLLLGELCADDRESKTDLTNTTALLVQSRKIDHTLLQLWKVDEPKLRQALGARYERVDAVVRQWLSWREGVWAHNEAIGIHLIQPIQLPTLTDEDWILRLAGMDNYTSLYVKLSAYEGQRDECDIQQPDHSVEVNDILAFAFAKATNKQGLQKILRRKIGNFNKRLFAYSLELSPSTPY